LRMSSGLTWRAVGIEKFLAAVEVNYTVA